MAQPQAPPSSLPPLPPGKPWGGLAVASLVVGIASLLLSLAVVGLVSGIAGLVMGRVALRRCKRAGAPPPGVVVAGVATSSAAVLIGGLLALVTVPQLIAHRHDFGQLIACAGRTTTLQEEQSCMRVFQDRLAGLDPAATPSPSPGAHGVNAQPPGNGGATWLAPAPVALGAPAVLGSAPSLGLSGDGHRFVFWTSPGGQLTEAIGVGAGWVAPSEVTGSFTDQPAAAADATRPFVVVRAPDGTLFAGAGDTGGRVSAVSPTAVGPLPGPPSAVADGAGRSVFWRGADNHLWQATWDGKAWGAGRSLGMGTLGSTPSASSDGHGRISVVWSGTDHDLYAAQSDGAGWVGPIHIPGMGPLASAPVIAVAPTGQRFVFWTGAQGALAEAIWDNRAWGGPYAVGFTTAGQPTVGIEAATGRIWLYWQGSDGALWQAVTRG